MESLVFSPASPSPNGVSSSPFPSIDPTLVVEHLAAVLEITLGATRRELESLGSLLSKAKYPDTVQRCTRFATESQVALYIQKDVVGDTKDSQQGITDPSSISSFQFHIQGHADVFCRVILLHIS